MCAEMQAGRFTVGDFALFTSYLANIGFSISLFGYMVFQHKRLKVSFDRMRSLFRPGEEDWIIEARETYLNEEPPELPVIHREPGEVLKELEVKNLSYHYPNSENGISDINFRLERGKFLVVTGRIGAGNRRLSGHCWDCAETGRDDPLERGRGGSGNLPYAPRRLYPQVPRLFSDPLREHRAREERADRGSSGTGCSAGRHGEGYRESGSGTGDVCRSEGRNAVGDKSSGRQRHAC